MDSSIGSLRYCLSLGRKCSGCNPCHQYSFAIDIAVQKAEVADLQKEYSKYSDWSSEVDGVMEVFQHRFGHIKMLITTNTGCSGFHPLPHYSSSSSSKGIRDNNFGKRLTDIEARLKLQSERMVQAPSRHPGAWQDL